MMPIDMCSVGRIRFVRRPTRWIQITVESETKDRFDEKGQRDEKA